VRVVLHAGAVADLTAAGDWYEAQLSGLGLDLADEVQRALDVIAASPTTWPLWPGVPESTGVRRFLLTGFPFAVAYLIEADRVVVLAVAHLRRRPAYWLRRTGK
jgi:plasmid stabilization system protein ParE